MATCSRCGSQTADTDAGGLCQNCASQSGHGAGAASDVPCQRCGMYLPSHELRMWNSRLYCAYCIMDVQDEEERMRHASKKESDSHEDYGGHGKGAENPSQQLPLQKTCQRCGKVSDLFYSLNGFLLCPSCYSSQEGKGKPSEPFSFGMAIIRIKRMLGMTPKPKIIAVNPFFEAKK